MAHKFHLDNIIIFKLNGLVYALHRHILNKLDVFKVLDDCPNQQIELTYDILPKDVEIFFSIITGEPDIAFDGNNSVARCLQIIYFMRYMGAQDNFIYNIMRSLLRDKKFVNYVYECDKMPFDNIMNDMLAIIPVAVDKKDFDRFIRVIGSSKNFGSDFKLKILRWAYHFDIQRVMTENKWEIIVLPYMTKNCNKHSSCKKLQLNIAYNLYRHYGFPIRSKSFHLGGYLSIGETIMFDNIFIDNVKIKKYYDGAYGGFIMTLANHFSELILKAQS